MATAAILLLIWEEQQALWVQAHWGMHCTWKAAASRQLALGRVPSPTSASEIVWNRGSKLPFLNGIGAGRA